MSLHDIRLWLKIPGVTDHSKLTELKKRRHQTGEQEDIQFKTSGRPAGRQMMNMRFSSFQDQSGPHMKSATFF